MATADGSMISLPSDSHIGQPARVVVEDAAAATVGITAAIITATPVHEILSLIGFGADCRGVSIVTRNSPSESLMISL